MVVRSLQNVRGTIAYIPTHPLEEEVCQLQSNGLLFEANEKLLGELTALM